MSYFSVLGFWQLCCHSYDWWRAIYSWTFWYCRWKLAVFYNVFVCNCNTCWLSFWDILETRVLANHLLLLIAGLAIMIVDAWPRSSPWPGMADRCLEYPDWMVWKGTGRMRAEYIGQARLSLLCLKTYLVFSICVCILHIQVASVVSYYSLLFYSTYEKFLGQTSV